MQRNRGKQQNGKDERSLQKNQRYQGNFSCKDGLNKGQKWYGPNKQKRLRRRGKNTQKNYTKKQRKTVEGENLEFPSRKLKIPRDYFMQSWAK